MGDPKVRKCRKCKQLKSIKEFQRHKYKDTTRPHWRRTCKACGLDQRKNAKLKYKFGITLARYNEMLEQQNHKCAICGTSNDELAHPLGVDHNHETKEVRGLLCVKCNAAIGFLAESIKNLKKTMAYLQEHT